MDKQGKGILEYKEANEDEEKASSSSLSNMSISAYSGRESFDSAQKKYTHLNPSMTLSIRHKYSINISEYHSEDDKVRLDDFFDDEIIQQRKVQKKDVFFRSGLFHPPFANHLSEIIYKFTQKPNQLHFSATIDAFLLPQIPIFKETQIIPEIEQIDGQGKPHSVLQALQDLFYHNKNTFLIYTFDWFICHLSFVCSLIIFWLQIEIVEEQIKDEGIESPKLNFLAKQMFIRNKKRKMKQNVCSVACLYAESRPQEINSNQVIVMVLYHFLGLLKQDQNLNFIQICNTQNKLINNIELFRRIKRKQIQFSSTSNKVIFQSQMRKYEYQNKLTSSLEKTHTLLHLITSHNFVSSPFLKFYQLDSFKNSRKEYQTKMQFTRMWMLEIVVRNCEAKKADSLYKSANYIVTFLGILKKMKEDQNLEGFSYLIPVLANIKHLMPNLWKYASQRRPQIDVKMNEHTQFLVKKYFTQQQLSGQKSAIIWGQTIFDITQKMASKCKNTTPGTVNIDDHKNFYDSYLSHLIQFRGKVQEEYERRIDKYNRDREIGSSFNMYLLDTYVPKIYKNCSMDEIWKNLKQRAEAVDKTLTLTLSIQLMDYIFVGSTTKYQRIEI